MHVPKYLAVEGLVDKNIVNGIKTCTDAGI